MRAIATAISDMFIIKPKVFGDARGFFFERCNRCQFVALTERDVDFEQDNAECFA